jgi:hypothetical protein
VGGRHLRTETDPVPKGCAFYFLEYRVMEKVQNLSNFEYDAPSSESFRIYFILFASLRFTLPQTYFCQDKWALHGTLQNRKYFCLSLKM